MLITKQQVDMRKRGKERQKERERVRENIQHNEINETTQLWLAIF